jgi:hypothetical protein
MPTWATNTIGLSLDVVGVILIWRYGLPEHIDRSGHRHLILEQTDEVERDTAERYDRISLVALLLLVTGFVLQLATHLKSAVR